MSSACRTYLGAVYHLRADYAPWLRKRLKIIKVKGGYKHKLRPEYEAIGLQAPNCKYQKYGD